jgi:hypothetical protein
LTGNLGGLGEEIKDFPGYFQKQDKSGVLSLTKAQRGV